MAYKVQVCRTRKLGTSLQGARNNESSLLTPEFVLLESDCYDASQADDLKKETISLETMQMESPYIEIYS